MQNSKRLKDLGFHTTSIYPNNSGTTKTKPHRKSHIDSGSDYDPSHDDDGDEGEEDLLGEDNAKVLILQSVQGLICCLLQD
jgi:hypothetical protein